MSWFLIELTLSVRIFDSSESNENLIINVIINSVIIYSCFELNILYLELVTQYNHVQGTPWLSSNSNQPTEIRVIID